MTNPWTDQARTDLRTWLGGLDNAAREELASAMDALREAEREERRRPYLEMSAEQLAALPQDEYRTAHRILAGLE